MTFSAGFRNLVHFVMKRAIVTSSRDMEDTVVDWRRDLEYIKGMRKFMDAPVDTMGCHKLADPLAEPKVHRFQVLVALMLSSQTRDQVNAAAMERLKKFGLTIDKIISMDKEALEQLIRPVGFYRRKSIFLQETAHILRNKYASDIPETFDELCALPGVGPKMANLVMQIAWGKCVGIAVDTHVHRITNRLGWINTTTPEKTEKALEILLPKEEWIPINHLLVGFGQMMCHPVRPRCGGCALGRTCPSSLFKEWYREREGIYVKKEIKDDVVVEEFEEEMEEEEMMGEKKEETMGEIKEEVKEEKMREKMGETVRETKEEKLRETKKEIKKETKEETMREMEAKKEEEEEEPVRKTKRTKIRIEKEEE